MAPITRETLNEWLLLLTCGILILLTQTTTVAAQSSFPFDRSLNRRRIGLTQANFIRLQSVYTQRASLNTREAQMFRDILAMKPVFNSKTISPGKNFEAVSGYRYCIKAVSAMGLLAAMQDNEAAVIAKRTLLHAADAFLGEPISPPAARVLLLDTRQDYATRIRAFNVLQESGDTSSFISRGEPMYLEVGALSACIAIGYDWLYQVMTPLERASVENASRELLLWSNNLHQSFFGGLAISTQKESNWNAVMNGGSGLLGLSALDDDAGFSCVAILSKALNPSSRRSLPRGVLAQERVCQAIVGLRSYWNAFTDSGTYVEGPTYWFYGMESYSLFSDSVQAMIGRTELWDWFGKKQQRSAEVQQALIHRPDYFWSAARESVAQVGVYGFSDAASRVTPSAYPFLSIARRSGSSSLREFGIALLAQQILNEGQHYPPYGTLWATFSSDWSRVFSLFVAPGDAVNPPAQHPLRSFVTPDHRLDIARLAAYSSDGDWTVMQKGGAAIESHAHLDSGSFTVRIGNEEWLSDLGAELTPKGYPPGYWTLPTTPIYSLGLRFFRKNDLSHNLVTLANRPLSITGKASIVSSQEGIMPNDAAPFAQVDWDTTSLYAPTVSRASRTLKLAQRGRYTSLDIVDTFEFPSLPPVDSFGTYATWRAVSCRPMGQIGDARSRLQNGVWEVRLSRGLPGEAEKGVLIQAFRPSGAEVRVDPADPNTTSRLRSPFATEVENSNSGCTVIEIPAMFEDLTSLGAGRYSLLFSVRIKREVL